MHFFAEGTPTDMAPFAERMAWTSGFDSGLQWCEARDIERVVVHWRDDVPAAKDVRLEYWKGQWPEKRVPKGQATGGGFPGWMAEDDWFNGRWQIADTVLAAADKQWIFTFNPLNTREFAEMRDFAARFRHTLRIRLVSDKNLPAIISWEAYTGSTWFRRDIVVERETRGQSAEKESTWLVEVYNGHLASQKPSSRLADAVGEGRATTLRKDKAGSELVRFGVWTTRNEDPTTRDHTVVTVRTGEATFSFAANDLDQGPIHLEDFGVLVSETRHKATLRQFRRTRPKTKTYYDRVFEMPEQTLARAWQDMPAKRSFYFVLGVEGRRQRFGVEPNGDVFRSHERQWFEKMPGRETERVKEEPNAVRWSFGLPAEPSTQRVPLRGYLPVMTTSWETDGLRYEQTAFATLLDRSLDDTPIRGDDPVVAIVLVKATNTSNVEKDGTLTLRVAAGDAQERLQLARHGYVRNQHGKLRCVITHRKGRLSGTTEGVRYSVHLRPSECTTIVFKLPFFGLNEAELGLLEVIQPQSALQEVTDYWERRIAAGTRIVTPEPLINDFYRAHITHLLINHERHPASAVSGGHELDIARVGSFRYGAYTNESVMQLSDLDRRGYSREAANGYELFLHFQGTVPLPGDFTSHRGVLYGAGGSEHGNYNQNHGWALWGLAEHYFLTRDRDWLHRVAGKIVEACDWITEQRERTKRLDAEGRPVIEYGFLPAGVLEDIQDYWYWLSTNAYTWWGMDRAAQALNDIHHPESDRLLREATLFKNDLVRGFTASLQRSAVVRLQDGTAVPHFPSHQHLRGRSYGWIRETLEGAIHLLRCKLIPPESRMGTWVMKDYEDNLYLSEQFGYSGASLPDRERYWFSRGGFSQQPNLLCSPLPYLFRNEIKHYLRAYFNAFAAGFHADTRMITEHPLPHLGDWAGDHFKTSDEAQSAYWLRLMFVYEEAETLCFGYALPRYWLRPGNRISIERARTYFGETSVSYEVSGSGRQIVARITPPTRTPPSEFRIRFRHAEGKLIRSVQVNGASWEDFDHEFVHVPATTSPLEIVASFGGRGKR